MPVTPAEIADLLDTRLQEQVATEFSKWPAEYVDWCSVDDSDDPYIMRGVHTGLATVPEVAAGVPYPTDKPYTRGTVTMTWMKFGIIVLLTKEARRDEQFGVLKKLGTSLGKALDERIQIEGAYHLNHAADAAVTGFDGVPLCSDSHPMMFGLQSNTLGAAVTLTMTTLWAAVRGMEGLYGDRGKRMRKRPRNLIASWEDEQTVIELLESEKYPYVMTNTTNAIRRRKLNPVFSRYLEQTVGAFVTAEDKPIDFVWNWRPEVLMDSVLGFEDDTFRWKGSMRLTHGWLLPWDIYMIPAS